MAKSLNNEETLPHLQLCSSCNKKSFNYVVLNDHICETELENKHLRAVLVIFSRIDNVKARIALRKTWLKYVKSSSAFFRYTFVIGLSENTEKNKMILDESSLYHDIFQGDFLDNYHGLTNKTLFAFQAISQYCPKADFLVKTDDDVFINVINLQKRLSANTASLESTVVGACTKDRRPVRTSSSKYFVSREVYPFSLYPKYCSGTCYITSVSLVQKIRKISVNVPFYHLEDVYVGMCLQLLGATVKNDCGFNINVSGFQLKDFYNTNFVSGHSLSPEQLAKVWDFQFSDDTRYIRPSKL